MSAKWFVRLVLLFSSIVAWLGFGAVFSQTTLAVGASGVSASGWIAQVIGLITSSGISVATIVAFVKKWEPVIHAVAPNVKLPNVDDPVVNKDLQDTVELGLAVAAYLKNRADKGAQRRFALAAVTELSDLADLKSPEISAAISNLGGALAARWFPAPPPAPTPAEVQK